MKIHPQTISIFLLPALLATGLCLQCERCKSATRSCTGPLQTCRDVENACLTLTTETRIGKVVKVATYKGCTKLRYCPLGPFTITTDLEGRIRSNSECCCSDHCNKGGLRLPVMGKPNHRWCPGHNSKGSKCSLDDKLHCHGREVNCFYLAGFTEAGGKNKTYVRQGCGTKHTCIDQLGIFGIPELFLETVTQSECSEAT
ncbi:phospholipase A2 inhibitor and Ly6/PLAUR domain-containing protein-like [Sceloporus undulatus]|uniref:phospholipase A2 inhibitor and Ly6/PLAUR domain-containing protein-like n=1 Tax=Sceloporus undulatus TaxID=8520 RepID=UPI001C4CAB46|nr:phospholipase A2 inhibitor and Ly6/PLAUR domain-containing protein-like [Sceloporus undulatus]